MNTSSNSTLNNFKQDPKNYEKIERDAANGLQIARDVLAVEDASDIGKSFMFIDGVFEKIIKSVTDIPFHCQKFSNRSKVKCTKKPKEIMHIAYDIPHDVGGHYAGVVKSGQQAIFFDSMCQSEYGPKFKRFVQKRYGKDVNVSEAFNKTKYQPSGGFIANKNALRELLKEPNVSANRLNYIHEISQYDVLSQHHFCYIESLVYLFHKLLDTPMGPSADPEHRLRFIKSVMWCLIFKYSNVNTNTQAFKYFERNFRYYVKLNNVVYNKNRGLYLPTNKPYVYKVETINMMPPSRAENASIEAIIQWSLKA
jgi:hypothetical protein